MGSVRVENEENEQGNNINFECIYKYNLSLKGKSEGIKSNNLLTIAVRLVL